MAPSSLVREKALLEVIRQGFLVSSRSQTHAMLGDRTSYVGMSDVGKYLECPRAAVASRIFPEPENLDRLLPLQRGHWFEQGIGEGLSALGLRVLPQLEIDWIYKDTPIRAHLDFTLVWDSPRKAVRKKYGKHSYRTIPITSDPGQRSNESSGCLVASPCFFREEHFRGTDMPCPNLSGDMQAAMGTDHTGYPYGNRSGRLVALPVHERLSGIWPICFGKRDSGSCRQNS